MRPKPSLRILSIGKEIVHDGLTIDSITIDSLSQHDGIEQYDYIIINGGDGAIRRIVKHLYVFNKRPIFILNPTGSFNVIAKIHKVPSITTILNMLAEENVPKVQKHHFFKLNEEVFLFSAGNMGDLQHIFLSETLRFGWLKHGILKYLLSILFLLPIHLIMTPFMLVSKTRFFIFTPARFIKQIGSFYGEVPPSLCFNLENDYNMLELDGDIVTIHNRYIKITQAGSIRIVTY
ncbi:MAG: hypothetical protein LGB52_04815 [Sulfurovum sp.]|nr:hypothetical protein [Sulfurovum sp.]